MADTSNIVVVCSEPRSSSLHGCSLLFDNPGQSLQSVGNLLYFDDGVNSDNTSTLYKILHDTVAPHNKDAPINRYLLRAKPADCYHVTVWGGVNDQNVTGVADSHRATVRDWLSRLPNSLSEHSLHTSIILKSPLVKRADWNVRFRLGKIVNWHNACLAALLQPFDIESERALAEIVRERVALSEEFEAMFGVKPPNTFVPHITLRAFADADAAQKAAPYITALSKAVHEQAGQMALAFDSISLYGFTNVTRVFKLKT